MSLLAQQIPAVGSAIDATEDPTTLRAISDAIGIRLISKPWPAWGEKQQLEDLRIIALQKADGRRRLRVENADKEQRS